MHLRRPVHQSRPRCIPRFLDPKTPRLSDPHTHRPSDLTGLQIPKFPNVPIRTGHHRSPNSQVPRSSDTQTIRSPRSPNSQIPKFPSFPDPQMPRPSDLPDTQIPKFPRSQIPRYPHHQIPQVPKFPTFQIPRYPDQQIPKVPHYQSLRRIGAYRIYTFLRAGKPYFAWVRPGPGRAPGRLPHLPN